MGPGVSTYAVGGTAQPALELSSCCDTRQAAGFRPLLCPEVGDCGPSICKGGGLHPESQGRDQQAKAAGHRSISRSAQSKAKEEAQMARRRARKFQQQTKRRGIAHDITAPLPPSSSSAQPLQVTATCGRGALACSEKMPVAKASDYGERRPRRRIQRMRVPSLRR